jgi:uncharacterized coiled-coil protein SlyX
MNEDLEEIERLIKQSAELSDSLIRLVRKLQEQNERKAQINQEQVQHLGTLHAQLTDLRTHIDAVNHEIPTQRYDQMYAEARQTVEEHALSPQEAVIEVLRAAVADKTITSEQAAAQLVSLLRADLPESRKIEIRQTAKASLEARDDIAGKIRLFLKNAPDQAEQQRKVNKRVFNNARWTATPLMPVPRLIGYI